jgi:alkylation response protein AidB-like acyl-CoA dehydrogenase
MDLNFTAEELDFRRTIREWVAANLPPELSHKVHHALRLTREDMQRWAKILGRQGWLGWGWPKEFGGPGWNAVQRHLFEEECALAGAPRVVPFGPVMVAPVIMAFGTPAQQQRFLPGIASGEVWWSQGYSEPGSGSDLASLKTRAERRGDYYVVNGQKTWTTLGQFADWIFLLARTDPNAPKKQAGISFILAEMNTPGITVRPIKLIDGSYEVNEVWFEDVRVPADLLVGEENAGWSYAKFLLSNERTGIARVGTTKVWLTEVKERAAKTPLGSSTLMEDPLFAARVAEVENELLALELTQLRVSGDEASGKPNPASSILKLRGTQLQQAVTDLLVEVAGPDALPFEAGDTIDSPDWAQHAAPRYLNFRKTSIYGGSNEVQRTIIASTILGL